MRFSRKEQKVRNGYFAAFSIVLMSYILVFYVFKEMERRIELVNHTNEVIMNLELLLSNMKDAETGVRGYVIMKNPEFLRPFIHSEEKADSIYKNLRKIISQDSVQKERLDSIGALVKEKFSIIKTAIDQVNKGKFTLDLLPESGYRGFYVMNDIRRIVIIMQNQEKQSLLKRTITLNYTSFIFKVIILLTLIFSILLAIYSFVTFDKENKAKKSYRKQLEEGIENLRVMNKELVELKSVEKFLVSGRISRTIAHEVRNPLTNITLAAEQLSDAVPETEDTILLIGMIRRNAIRINDLVSDLLNSTKFSQLELEFISIHKILDNAIDSAKDRLNLNAIQVVRKYDSKPCMVNVDSKLMHIAFLNIIVNAIEAAEPGKGMIELKTECFQTKCIVYIKDNGSGMDEEALSRIFEPYFTSKQKGNGLGLTNTQNIILNHKGSIQVESKAGEGTIFIITLLYNQMILTVNSTYDNDEFKISGKSIA